MSSAQTVLGIISWCLIFIAIVVFLSICMIIYKSRQELQDVSFLLICNTCSTSLLTCITVCVMTSSNLTTGFLTNNLYFCYAWGLLYDIFQCSIYYSCCLQSIYRLCRVVFYTKKLGISYSFYKMLTIGQWLLVVVLLLPPIPLNWYVHLPTENYCLIPYTNVGGEIYHIAILYLIPLVCITITYTWIIRFIRHSSRTSAVLIATKQRQRNLRDLTIVRNIVILISILALLRFPTVIFMIYGIIAGSLHSLTYSIVGLITSGCLVLIGLMQVFITPPLRKNFVIIFHSYYSLVCVRKPPLTVTQTSVAVITTNLDNDPSKLTNIVQEEIVEQDSGQKF